MMMIFVVYYQTSFSADFWMLIYQTAAVYCEEDSLVGQCARKRKE